MDFKHPYLPVTDECEKEMLSAIGVSSLEDLFCNIPGKFRLSGELDVPPSHSEWEVINRIRELAGKNRVGTEGRFFLGSGVEPHYIPAAVSALANRAEYVTAYTSYQPEISQGMLQTLFEYQSLLAELLEIDVVNSSMYDLSTSLAEAMLMSSRVKKNRTRFLVPELINPAHLQVMQTYAEPAGVKIETIANDKKSGLIMLEDLESKLDNTVSGVIIQNPNYLGVLESNLPEIGEMIHSAGALFIAGVDILSLGLLTPPGKYDADIVVAEGQPLGTPMSYGGPLLGIFGCKMDRKLLYQMPGRLVGMTTTQDEPLERGFVLTLSPREQHIRREKATSNICSNQALIAVTAGIYLSVLGQTGIRDIGENIAYKSNYAARQLNDIPGVDSPAVGKSIWKEFAVRFEGITSREVHDLLLEHDFHGGVLLNEQFPDLGEAMLFCVTEYHSKKAIDALVKTVDDIVVAGGAK